MQVFLNATSFCDLFLYIDTIILSKICDLLKKIIILSTYGTFHKIVTKSDTCNMSETFVSELTNNTCVIT